jgi:DNA-binding SARP family transcriptional activator
MISCRTLGALEVLVDGAPAPRELRRKQNLALLLYLAHSPRGTRAKQHLISLFWPDVGKPNQSLSETGYLLRKHGGVGLTETTAGQIRLDLDTVELDTRRFEALVAKGQWAEAVALVAGPFLDGFSPPRAVEFDDWVSTQRLHWGPKCVEAMVRHAEDLLKSGAAEPALLVAERAAELASRPDQVERVRLSALSLLDRRDEALEGYRRFEKRLRDLGTAPDAATRDLADRIRQKQAPSVEHRKRSEPKRRAPLVGRERELKSIYECWTRCRQASEPGLGLVLGDPGSGKTRFLEEVVSRAYLEGAASAVIHLVPSDLAQPGSGLIALAEGGLLDAPGVASAPAPALAALAEQSSVWAERFPRRDVGGLPPLPRAFSEVVRGAASEKSVLLAVDDAQWMDPESLLALTAVLRDLTGRPVMVLLAASADPPHPALDQVRALIGRDQMGATVALDLLGPKELAALGRWALPTYDAQQIERLVRRVQADSGGLPLIAFELISGVASGLELRRAGPGVWPASQRTLYDTFPGDLPDAVVGAVRVSFRRLSADAQLALVAVAVIGERVTRQAIGRSTGLPDERLDRALAELEWQRWVVVEGRGYAFLARIIRDITVEMKTPGERARLRERAGVEPKGPKPRGRLPGKA